MKVTNVYEAKAQFSRLLERVAQGEEIVIGRNGKPIARLVRYEEPTKPREGGQWRGRVRIGEDFDEPLPPEIERGFRGDGS